MLLLVPPTVLVYLAFERAQKIERGALLMLERMADAVAVAVLALDDRIEQVEVAVRKLDPPVPQRLATSGVRIIRAR
jgi:dihydroneopterin aldolase